MPIKQDDLRWDVTFFTKLGITDAETISRMIVKIRAHYYPSREPLIVSEVQTAIEAILSQKTAS
jgi:hypothetical protein